MRIFVFTLAQYSVALVEPADDGDARQMGGAVRFLPLSWLAIRALRLPDLGEQENESDKQSLQDP